MQNNDGRETRQERRARLRKSATHSNARISKSRDVKEIADQNLIFRVAKGDDAALEELMRRYSSKVRQTVFRILKDVNDLDAGINRVWTSVWRGARKFKYEAKVSSWIYRVACNEALMMLREANGRDGKKKVTCSFHALDEDVQEAVIHGYGTIDAQGLMSEDDKAVLRQQLVDAVLRLEQEHAEIFNLCYARDIEPHQAAKILRLTVSATKSRLYRTRAALRKRLREQGLELKGRLRKAA